MTATKIKICGVTLPDDAARAAAAGVDFLGINFYAKSKRCVAPGRAPLLAAAARAAGPEIRIVGVFVDATPEMVATVMQEVDLDIVQLHGDESPDAVVEVGRAARRPVWKALAATAVDRIPDYRIADAILVDTPTAGFGGSGETFDWTIARDAQRRYRRTVVLAGGLRPDNVAEAIAAATPWAVDVASGVESAPRIKDPDKLAAFVAAVRGDKRRPQCR